MGANLLPSKYVFEILKFQTKYIQMLTFLRLFCLNSVSDFKNGFKIAGYRCHDWLNCNCKREKKNASVWRLFGEHLVNVVYIFFVIDTILS